MEFKKSILWFVKNEEGIKANQKFFNRDSPSFVEDSDEETTKVYNEHFNLELDVFTHAFENSSWKCYWTCIDYINYDHRTIKIFNRSGNDYQTVNIDSLDSVAHFAIFKYLGSVEGQREKILKAINFLETGYKGILINHPTTMKYFITKKYLIDMAEMEFPNLMKNTFSFPNTVSYDELSGKVRELGGKVNEYIIKSLTGELANSFSLLSSANEDYLRRKEEKLGGWILQPLCPHVWRGEYRLIFFANVCTLGLKKSYVKTDDSQIIPNEKNRTFENYVPTQSELDWATTLRERWEKSKKHKIYYFRLDFVKDDNNNPIMLEFEALNPGFGFRAISDKKRTQIANEFVNFLNSHTF